jgi:hypothetical protein
VHILSLGERIELAGYSEIEGILSLASKYDIPYLRRRALAQFREYYPDDFDVWSTMRWLCGTDWQDSAPNPATLDLARKVGALCAIPAIMLRMSFGGLDEHLLANLGPGDRSSMLMGMSKLWSRTLLHVYGWFFQAAPDCPSPEYCLKKRINVLRDLENSTVQDTLCPSMSYPYWYDGLLQHEDDYICKACESAADKCYDKGKLELWEELPSIFGLPSWEELRRESRLE